MSFGSSVFFVVVLFLFSFTFHLSKVVHQADVDKHQDMSATAAGVGRQMNEKVSHAGAASRPVNKYNGTQGHTRREQVALLSSSNQ